MTPADIAIVLLHTVLQIAAFALPNRSSLGSLQPTEMSFSQLCYDAQHLVSLNRAILLQTLLHSEELCHCTCHTLCTSVAGHKLARIQMQKQLTT